MGVPVLILGASGSGKSASMRNFEQNEVGIFNVASKPLPFRKQLLKADGADYPKIIKGLSNPKLKTYVIDDSQYLLCFEAFARAKETGYNKFTDMALNFYNLIRFVIDKAPKDVIVYFLHHTETDENGKLKAKTLGKMLDNQLTVEGLFSIVLLTQVEGNEHCFITNSDGNNTTKSPLEMFEASIDNDLKMVDDTIREYYGLNEQNTNKKGAEK